MRTPEEREAQDVQHIRDSMEAKDARDENVRQIQLSRVAIRWILLAAFVVVVAAIGLAIVLSNVDKNVDNNTDAISDLKTETAEVRDLVIHVEAFVDRLEEPSDEDREQNAAINRAVALVPEIKDILCEQFPEVARCQVP